MANRDDVTVDFELSPRLAEIALPSQSISAQDGHDTLASDQETPEGMNHPQLVESAGKEDLGGGVSVGITLTAQNVQWAFGRTDPRCSGSVTTTNATILIDSLATFQTDGVQRGDWVINFTDQSVTEVLTVDSETQLTCRVLSGGTNDAFTSGDSYKVWEVSECQLDGGNQVAVDDVGGAINPLFTTFGRFATRSAASSATGLSQETLESQLLEIYRLLGLDVNNPVSMTGDGETSKIINVGGFTVTFTPSAITRT